MKKPQLKLGSKTLFVLVQLLQLIELTYRIINEVLLINQLFFLVSFLFKRKINYVNRFQNQKENPLH
jgi:hypothetical protein